jgi:hypothetical protein
MVESFHRYAGSPREDIFRRMPSSHLRARTAPLNIGELLGHYEDFSKSKKEQQMYPWARGFVLGYPLPHWQREASWTQAQNCRFIDSIWRDIDLGSYLVNVAYELTSLSQDGQEPSSIYKEFSFALLDGQQRLSAIEAYVLNRFMVPDAEGVPCYWKDLGTVERRFFCNRLFAQSSIECWDEAALREVYDLRSFGGTAHQESQRASLVVL